MTFLKPLNTLLLYTAHVANAISGRNAQRPVDAKRSTWIAGNTDRTIEGIARPDEVICQELTTGSQQAATLELMGKNAYCSIDSSIDAQHKYRITTNARPA